MDYPKEILVKDYFEIHNYYSNIYGIDKTIVLIQVGSFHEAYCTDTDGINLLNLSQKLDICCTKKNNSQPVSKNNPRMMGFPIYVTNNFIDKLIDLNFTIVLIDQVSDPPRPKRKVTNIYSPGTFIEKTINKTLFIVSIIIDIIKESKTNNLHLCLGLSAYDLSTGKGCFYETYSNSSDNFLALDNVNYFLENYPPIEIILEENIKDNKIYNMSIEEILRYLNINTNIITISNKQTNDEYTNKSASVNIYKMKIVNHRKISWQIELLNKIYNFKTNVDIIELLGLQYYNWARLSLIILLDYIIAHQPNLVKNIQLPILFDTKKYLYLGNRALDQLDVISNNTNGIKLFNVINFTTTTLGKRYLINQLTMPLIDPIKITERYNLIQQIIDNEYYYFIENHLKNIYDLDKLGRKLDMNTISPHELYQIYISFIQINNLIDYFRQNKLLDIFIINNEYISDSYALLEWIKTRFDIEKINGLNFNNFNEIDYSIYKQKIHNQLDELQNNIDINKNFMTYLIKELEQYIDDKIYLKKNININSKRVDIEGKLEFSSNTQDKNFIILKYNDRDGHYLLLTSRRCEILKKNLNKIKEIFIGKSDSNNDKNLMKLNVSDLEFNNLPKSTNTKITCKKIKEFSLELIKYKLAMAKYTKDLFKADMLTFFNHYKKLLCNWSNKIAYIDFINSGAICAIQNHYSKPILQTKNNSYFKAKELRHPIVEKINSKTNYIPHDIELGHETDQYGILLYGINSAGKSTLMKAIGLNIILAQIGYFTSTTYFEFYPYQNLFTRINGNDNIFKNLSSFMVEMLELIAILKRNNSNTLVIADELCHTTEELSANVIITYMLEVLSKNHASFITATHLHKLAKIKSIKILKELKIKHIKITYDEINDLLIYDRNLLEGEGESFYGLQIAKYMMKDQYFNDRTTELLDEYNEIKKNKNSKYNSKLYLNYCEICKTQNNLETHHIFFQKDFNKLGINKSKFYLQKNSLANLVVLCMQCHDEIDKGTIIINGWIETSQGTKLDYIINNTKIIKKKYDENMIAFVKQIQLISNNDPRLARLKIQEKLNLKISTKTILNMWNDQY
jgi:DNA mismatch repair protein MutS